MEGSLLRARVALALAAISAAAGVAGGHPNHEAAGEEAPLAEGAVVGAGAHRFRVSGGWFQSPGDGPGMGTTHGDVAVDSQGRVYLTTETAEHPIIVFGPGGDYLKTVGKGLAGCHSLLIEKEGDQEFIYTAHLAGRRALKLTLDGDVVWEIPAATFVEKTGKYENAGQFSPTAVCVGPAGQVYVADGYGQNWVHQFDADRNYVRSFGGRGNGVGQFQVCHGMKLDRRYDPPRLLVCDRQNDRLQHFDVEGRPLGVVAEGLKRPCAVSFRGAELAVAELGGRVTLLGGDNKVLAHLGESPDPGQRGNFEVPPAAWEPTAFTAPHGISHDQAGNVVVTDWNKFGRVRRLERLAGE